MIFSVRFGFDAQSSSHDLRSEFLPECIALAKHVKENTKKIFTLSWIAYCQSNFTLNHYRLVLLGFAFNSNKHKIEAIVSQHARRENSANRNLKYTQFTQCVPTLSIYQCVCLVVHKGKYWLMGIAVLKMNKSWERTQKYLNRPIVNYKMKNFSQIHSY